MYFLRRGEEKRQEDSGFFCPVGGPQPVFSIFLIVMYTARRS